VAAASDAYEPGENLRKWKKTSSGIAALPGLASQQDSPRQSVETQTALSAANAAALASASASADTTPRSVGPSPVSRGLKEESFSRSGSGRKLPQIPPPPLADNSSSRVRCNTLPSRRPGDNDSDEEKFVDNDPHRQRAVEDGGVVGGGNVKAGGNKPKALEFWESMENIERNDFRYNTIHRMSVGRRQLPKPPGGGGSNSGGGDPHYHHQRSQSIDHSCGGGDNLGPGPSSLNSSFSGPSSLPLHSAPHSPRLPMKKMPPDGASLQSADSNEEAEVVSTTASSRRGEVEGSSDKSSPPTSLVQGVAGSAYHHQGDKAAAPNPAYEWVRGSFDQSQRKKWGLPSPIFLQGGGGNSGAVGSAGGQEAVGEKAAAVPYTVLLQELMQAKKQLQELYHLVRNLPYNKH
jgi:hypothetical protein